MTMALVDEPAPARTAGRRAEVLGLLRASDGPLSAADVAAATGLHVNTARFHLDALVEGRLVERTSEARDQPGRPRILYAAQGPIPGPRSYALLAEMLTGLLASFPDAGPAAVAAGQAWGRHLVERAAPSEQLGEADAVARLNRLLDAIGFEPEVRTTDSGSEVCLRHCPFREVAAKHNDVVCAIHLGLMQGALSELQAPVDVASLEPFVTPNLCVARLTPRRSGRKTRGAKR